MRMRCVPLFAALIGLASMSAPVAAQLYGNFIPRGNHDNNPVNVWFGAAKDAAGRYVPGATIVLQTRQVDFVAVTNGQGRYRLELPVNIRPSEVRVRCSRQGYLTARVIRRLPRGGALSPVEANCELK